MLWGPNPRTPAATGPAIVYIPTQEPPTVIDEYSNKKSIASGTVQIIIGVLCIIVNVVSLADNFDYMSFIGHGIWCGIMFIATGATGIEAGKHKTRCQIISYMVLCIISACFTIGLLTVSIIATITAAYHPRYYDCYNQRQGSRYCKNGSEETMALEILLAVSGVVEAVIAIYGAVTCCKSGVCNNCCDGPDPTTAIAGVYVPNNVQMIHVNQMQAEQYVYSPQPVMMAYPSGSVPPQPAFSPTYAQSAWPTYPLQPQATGFPAAQATGFPAAQAETAAEYTAPLPSTDNEETLCWKDRSNLLSFDELENTH